MLIAVIGPSINT